MHGSFLSGRRPNYARTDRRRTPLRVETLENRLVLTTLLPGFSEATIATGISGPTAMEFSPDGRLWVLEQGGNVKLVRADGSTFTALHQTVDANGERGMLGIAFDPSFASNHFAYLYYTNPNAGGATWATGVHNQLSRFTVDDTNPSQPLFTNEAAILDWNNLSGATNHNGGAIHFGIDGMLYANAGDNVQSFTGPDSNSYRVSQTLANLLGKQLRIDVAKFNNGTATRDDTVVGHLIPTDNPFVGTATGINQLIYVLGLRNPFTFAVQPGTGRMLINDVGEVSWEEVDDSIAGGNYGWSGGSTDGFGHAPPAFAAGVYHEPLLAYAHSGSGSLATGSAIVGSTFYNPTTVQFPASYVGKYFYEDLGSGFIRYFNPNTPNVPATPDGNSVAFASSTPGGLRDLKVDAAGNLYYLAGGDGSVRRISYTNAQVTGRRLFYNQSSFDGNSASIGTADDAAIATDKTAYLPGGGTSTFASVSSYTKGINGVMIDLAGSHGTITANDFIFKVGNNNSPNLWSAGTAPSNVSVRAAPSRGFGSRGNHVADWRDARRWLQVIVRGNDARGAFNPNAGLALSDIFYFGSAAADSGGGDPTSFVTNVTDEASARNDPHGLGNKAAITNVNDFTRDGFVNSSDQASTRLYTTSAFAALQFLSVAAGGPFAPDTAAGGENLAASGDVGIASALIADSSTRPKATAQAIPIATVSGGEENRPRPSGPGLSSSAIDFQLLGEAKSIDDIADLDESLLSALIGEV